VPHRISEKELRKYASPIQPLKLAKIRTSEEIVSHHVFAEFEEFSFEIERREEQRHDFKCHIVLRTSSPRHIIFGKWVLPFNMTIQSQKEDISVCISLIT